MNTKARLLFIAATVVLLLGAVPLAIAGTVINLDSSSSIAPSSIPVPETGSPNVIVAMNKLQMSGVGPGQSTATLDALRVQLTTNGILNPADIASIRVWFEGNGGNGLYDNGTPLIDDVNVLSGGPYTFSANPVDITLDNTKTVVRGGQTVRVYICIELTSSAATAGATVGVQTIRFTESGRTHDVTGHGVQKPLDKYRVGLTATGIAPATEYQGESASILKLSFLPVDTDASTKIQLGSMKVHQVGTPWSADTNLNSGGVVLYEDTNENGTYDDGIDSQLTSATLGSPTAQYATLTIATPDVVPSTGKTYFVVVNLALTATINNVVQLQVDNPSTDISFSDAYADDVAGPDYAYLPANRPYTQKGYLTDTSATPTTGNATTILKQTIPQPPTVTSFDPGNGAANILRNINITASFSKSMWASTINTSTFKVFNGPTEVLGDVTYNSGTQMATFNPNSDLSWGTTYSVYIYGNGTSGVQDNVNDLYMASNKVWSFTTVIAVQPTVLSTSPVNAAIEVPRTTTVTATFSKPMELTSINASTFTLFDGTDYVTGTVTYDGPSRTATFTQTPPPLAWGTIYTASITEDARDTDGLPLLSTHTWTFTSKAVVNPLVTSTLPANGASDVARTANITMTFSADMDQNTIKSPATTFTLKDSVNNPIAGNVTYDTPTFTATFDPTPTLAWGETYTATMSTAAKDLDGVPMLADKSITFTTTPPIPPIVVSRNPPHGDVNVDPISDLKATFSKDMDLATINPSTCLIFRDNNGNNLYDGGDTLVSAAASRTTLREITINPTLPLGWNTVYTINVTTGAKDTDGIAVANTIYWFFTTQVPVNPTVSNTVPAPDATGVLPADPITATFSKDMKEAQTEGAFTLFLGDVGGTVVAGGAHYNTGGSRTLTFTPSASLTPGEKYTARITTAAVDTTDLPLLSNKVWSFWVSTRPSVLLSSPANNSVGVSRSATIKAVFSKALDDTTIIDSDTTDPGSNFIVYYDANSNSVYDAGDTILAGKVTYDVATFTATFTPDADLVFLPYRVTVKAGPTGVKDSDGIEMAADVTWTFSTKPTLDEPVAANNKITPTSTDPVTIFIPQPTADPADRVTVQVFTATGKKVRTLINNQPWNSFEASLPLLWDGTNDRGERLGPGLYFIQIRATKYVRSLKAMIVR